MVHPTEKLPKRSSSFPGRAGSEHRQKHNTQKGTKNQHIQTAHRPKTPRAFSSEAQHKPAFQEESRSSRMRHGNTVSHLKRGRNSTVSRAAVSRLDLQTDAALGAHFGTKRAIMSARDITPCDRIHGQVPERSCRVTFMSF